MMRWVNGPWGVQAAQIETASNWIKVAKHLDGVTLHTSGPMSQVAGLIGAAAASETVDEVTVHGGLSSLQQLVDDAMKWQELQPLFCYGLLTVTDIDALVALCEDQGISVKVN